MDWFNRDLKGWFGPGRVVGSDIHHNTKIFVVNLLGELKRAHPSHVRHHVDITAMSLPPKLLRIAKKTHGKKLTDTEKKQEQQETEKIPMDDLEEVDMMGTSGDVIPGTSGGERPSPDQLAGGTSLSDGPSNETSAPAQSPSPKVEEASSPSSKVDDTSLSSPKVEENGSSSSPSRIENVDAPKFQITKNYLDKLYKDLLADEQKRERLKRAKENPGRIHWRDRKEGILNLAEILDGVDLTPRQREKAAAGLYSRVQNDGQFSALLFSTLEEKADFAKPLWRAALTKEVDAHRHVFNQATDEDLARNRAQRKRPIPCKVLTAISKKFFCLSFCFCLYLRGSAEFVHISTRSPSYIIHDFSGVILAPILSILVPILIEHRLRTKKFV